MKVILEKCTAPDIQDIFDKEGRRKLSARIRNRLFFGLNWIKYLSRWITLNHAEPLSNLSNVKVGTPVPPARRSTYSTRASPLIRETARLYSASLRSVYRRLKTPSRDERREVEIVKKGRKDVASRRLASPRVGKNKRRDILNEKGLSIWVLGVHSPLAKTRGCCNVD